MCWKLRLADSARKLLQRLPAPDRARTLKALGAIERNPTGGDVARLHDLKLPTFRRRVGDYRIFFDLHPDSRMVAVTAIMRRTTTTYRKHR